MTKEFENKTFIVTGASSGIGKATAIMAVERGAKVALVARREKELKSVASSLKSSHVTVVPADLTQDEERKRVISETVKHFGAIDVLVNAAGIIGYASLEATTMEQWDSMLDINLRSVFRLTQLALPSLITRKGNIVNLSSITGVRAFSNLLAYCVSKAGLEQMTRCAALDLAPKGVRVNAVTPGVISTNLYLSGGMEDEKNKAFMEHSKTVHPLGRLGTPEEVAELILFLASDRAGWITGGSFSIDGGRSITCAR